MKQSDISINGVRLGQDLRTLAHLVEKTSKIYKGFAPGLEQWNWKPSRGKMLTPTRVQFVDGMIASISGSELVFMGSKFGRAADEEELQDAIPGLLLDTQFETRTLEVATDGISLAISLIPRFKTYDLTDDVLLKTWIERYKNDRA